MCDRLLWHVLNVDSLRFIQPVGLGHGARNLSFLIVRLVNLRSDTVEQRLLLGTERVQPVALRLLLVRQNIERAAALVLTPQLQ